MHMETNTSHDTQEENYTEAESTPVASGYEDSWAIHWQAAEYTHHDKTPDWYWWLGILTLGVAVFAMYTENTLFAFLIIIASFTLALYSSRHPDMIDYAATERGIRVKNKLYPYQSLEAFWIHDPNESVSGHHTVKNEHDTGPGTRKLFLESNKPFAPLITIPLSDDISPAELRRFLLAHMSENEIQEPFSQKITDLFHV